MNKSKIPIIFLLAFTFFKLAMGKENDVNIKDIKHLIDIGRVDKAIILVEKIKNPDVFYEACVYFAKSGNPSRATEHASELLNDEQKYNIAEMVIERGNPRNGRELLKKISPEYAAKGIDLLYLNEQTFNAINLEDFLKENGFEKFILDYSSNEIRFNHAMKLVEDRNCPLAARVAMYIRDNENKYHVAKSLIEKLKCPNNAIGIIKTMPEEYKIRGVKLLEETGNPGNEKILRRYINQ